MKFKVGDRVKHKEHELIRVVNKIYSDGVFVTKQGFTYHEDAFELYELKKITVPKEKC